AVRGSGARLADRKRDSQCERVVAPEWADAEARTEMELGSFGRICCSGHLDRIASDDPASFLLEPVQHLFERNGRPRRFWVEIIATKPFRIFSRALLGVALWLP